MNIMGILPSALPTLPKLSTIPTVAFVCVATVQIVLGMITFVAMDSMPISILTFISGFIHDYLAGLCYFIIYMERPMQKQQVYQIIFCCGTSFILNCIVLNLNPITKLSEISQSITEISTGAVSFIIICSYIVITIFLCSIKLNRKIYPVTESSEQLLNDP
jgi:peptidoglycan biosynthesis protein MviN/MurJ (putative lipid II flippase)